MRRLGRVLAPVEQPQAGWSLLIVAAAVIGGLAAAGLRHVSLLVAFLVPLAIGGLTVYALARFPGQQPVPSLPPGPARHELRPVPAPVSEPETEDLVRLQPIGSRSATGAPWWQQADGSSAPPVQDVVVASACDVADYLGSALIAQCPRCGAFELEAMSAGSRWGFQCECCDFTWDWQPGTPWPPVQVRPGRRRRSRPPAPLSTSRAP